MENKQALIQTVAENPEVLQGVLETPQAKTIIYQSAEMSVHTGPLPSPKDVAAYSQSIPNFGERIMVYAEKEQAMRHQVAQKSLYLNQLGLWLGIFALLVITGFCVYLAFLGHVQAAAWVMVAVLAAVVGTFVIGKQIKNNANNE